MLFRTLTFIAGFLLIAAGIGIVLKNWVVLAAMVKAVSGIILALIGLVVMFAATIKP